MTKKKSSPTPPEETETPQETKAPDDDQDNGPKVDVIIGRPTGSYLSIGEDGSFIPTSIFNYTGVKIGGTISALGALDETMKQLQEDTIKQLQPGIDKQLTKFIEPIKTDLENARAQIQETTSSLTGMKTFMEKNETALTTLFSVDGKMSGLESQMNSAFRRLDKLELDKTESWQKNTTWISIAVAVIGTCIGLFGCAFAAIALYSP